MQNQITSHIESYLSPYLCGYRKGYRTQHALVSHIEKWKVSTILAKNYSQLRKTGLSFTPQAM